MAAMRAAIETGSFADFAAAFENTAAFEKKTNETDPTRTSLDIT